MPQNQHHVDQAIKLLQQALGRLENTLELAEHWDEIGNLVHLASKQIAVAHHLEGESIQNESESSDSSSIRPNFPVQNIPSAEPEASNTEEEASIIEPASFENEIQPPNTGINEVSVEQQPAHGPSLVQKLQEQKIQGLAASLSINDRVKFATSLFGGDIPSLLHACKSVEACGSFEEALEILDDLSEASVDWEAEDAVTETFLTLVRRLFVPA